MKRIAENDSYVIADITLCGDNDAKLRLCLLPLHKKLLLRYLKLPRTNRVTVNISNYYSLNNLCTKFVVC